MADQVIQVNCGFFDSINEDRLYSAEQMNKPLFRVISNGVFATPDGTPSTDLQVLSADNGMNIIIKSGDAFFANKWFENPADIPLIVPNNTAIVPRRDSVIAQVNKNSTGRVGNIVYRAGEPGSNPQAPSINTDSNIIEYRIANIYVDAGATTISQSNITDLRGSSECPWITSLVQQVDTSELFRQYQDWFEERKQQAEDDFDDFEKTEEQEFLTWFNNIKGQLSEDAAGNLQEQIDDINENTYTKTQIDNKFSDVYSKTEIDEQNENFALKANMVYSTDEVDTGQTWVEGKTIYRKVFYGSGFSSNVKTIDISNLNVDSIFFITDKSHLNWSYGSQGGRWSPIIQTAVSRAGTSEPNVGYYQSEVFANNARTQLVINCGKNMIINWWVLTIEYTKNTN